MLSNITVMAQTAKKTPFDPACDNDATGPLRADCCCGSGEITFDGIVDEYAEAVAQLANRLLGYPGEVEDVVQDVFLAAFTGLRKFRRQCSIKTWLFTITINTCRTRRHHRRFRIDPGRLAFRQPDRSDHSAINDETFATVRKAISELGTKYREPVVLKYIQQLSTEEITSVLGISENTLNVRLSRARQKLKGQLAELIEE